MRILATSLGLLAIVSPVLGCGGVPDEPVGTAAQAQLDGGNRTYNLTQSGVITGAAWAGSVGGVPVEYWVASPSYAAGATRTITEASQTCASFRDTVCGSSWSGSTYYRAVVNETTLDCAFPPGPCTPAPGGVSFLASGSYVTNGGRPQYAWTYVSSGCEYWAMDHTISTGTSVQSQLRPAYTSLGEFESSVCAMSVVPSLFYTVDYVADPNFCTAPRC